ncbi:hypothetical protein Desaci_2850 [Desulfosporosinus acidiphilus SJ4]|uniref:FlxA-like protein n=1 Tax=Desulfosporosinus acidiphilus (strain DSM 22704 / JCM 16185 / SJ4) TaxID=646529 RepID=I4D7J0_DESAJ|nr:FlxA-like family protein [Desulfosporosinus acidiphilus]AFM41764.1 hypothetical protein Desaci_2850 [Desulfosporosinus acidiphilus SJ4]
MNISAILSELNNDYSSSVSDAQIKKIQNQIQTLDQDLKSENQSKDDARTKQIKVQQIQTQIELLEAQLKQLESKKNQNNTSNQQAENISPQQSLRSSLNNSTIDIRA